MVATVQSLGINKLSRDERMSLVEEIWNTIADEQTPMLLTDAKRKELQRRIDEDEASPDDGMPWEQFKAQLLARLQKS